MGSYLGKPQSKGVLTRKGVVLAVMVGLHAVAIAGLMNVRLADRPQREPEQAVEVFLLDEPQPIPPPESRPQLQPVELRAPTVPEVTIPLVEAPVPVASITVVAAERAPRRVEAPAEDLDAPVSVDEVEYLSRVPPRYPVAARRARAEGTVYVRIFIDQEGLPREVRVHRSCGHEVLDDAALDAARRFRFKPHRVNGVARNALAIVPIEFSLTVRTANLR
jgi:periplasmic protein TonB